MKKNSIRKGIFLGFVLQSVLGVYAFAGNETHGGDICENRFQTVRDDLSTWILKGGAAGLYFPQGVTLAQYNRSMPPLLKSAKVSCTEETLYIGSAEKTCTNRIANDGSAVILCNVRRFMDTSHADQYTLVHHEYAGLAGFEKNSGESSNYFLSNQITGFLENQTDQRLVVKPPVPETGNPFDPQFCEGASMTSAEALRFFTPGESTSNFVRPSFFRQRERKCNKIGGCGEAHERPTVFYKDNGPSYYVTLYPVAPSFLPKDDFRFIIRGDSIDLEMPTTLWDLASNLKCGIQNMSQDEVNCDIRGHTAISAISLDQIDRRQPTSFSGRITNSCFQLINSQNSIPASDGSWINVETVWYSQY